MAEVAEAERRDVRKLRQMEERSRQIHALETGAFIAVFHVLTPYKHQELKIQDFYTNTAISKTQIWIINYYLMFLCAFKGISPSTRSLESSCRYFLPLSLKSITEVEHYFWVIRPGSQSAFTPKVLDAGPDYQLGKADNYHRAKTS